MTDASEQGGAVISTMASLAEIRGEAKIATRGGWFRRMGSRLEEEKARAALEEPLECEEDVLVASKEEKP